MTTLQIEGSGPTVPAKIFCGGLSDVTTNSSLRTHFSPYGEIVDSVVLTEKTTGRSRGFGFITFASEESVDAVLSSPQIVDGKEIDCKRAVPRGVIQGNDAEDSTDNLSNNINNSNLNNTSINGNLGNNSVNNSNGNPNSGRSHTNSGSIGSNNTGSGFNATKIFVGGLPQSCTDDKLREHFGKYGAIKNLSVMVDRDTNRHRGFGFVEYESPESVEEVMRHYYDHQIDNKWVECKKALPREIMAGNSNINTSNGASGLGGSGTGGCIGNPRSRANATLAASAAGSNYADYYRNPYLSVHPAGVPSQQIYGRYGRHDPRYMYAGYTCTPNIYTGGYGQIPPPIHSASGPGAQISPVVSSVGSHAVSTHAHYSDLTSEQSNLQVSTGNSSNINSSGSNSNGNGTNVASSASYENQGDYLSDNQGVTDTNVHLYHPSRTGIPPQLAQPPHLYAPSNPVRPGPYTQGRYATSGTLPYSIPGAVPTHGRIRGIY